MKLTYGHDFFKVVVQNLGVAFLVFAPASVLANTSSVFSPDVDAGEKAIEFRVSNVPSSSGEGSTYSQRLHFQYGLNDSWRVRIIGAHSHPAGGDFEYSYTRLEVQQQLLENEDAGWDSALRYEFQVADQANRPDRFRLGWTGKVDLDEGWQLRSNALLGRELGSNRGSGLKVETRFQVTRALASGSRLGIEMFNDLNRTTNFGSFDSQEHQLGPIYKFNLGQASLSAGWLFGLSDAADDHNFRLHVILPL